MNSVVSEASGTPRKFRFWRFFALWTGLAFFFATRALCLGPMPGYSNAWIKALWWNGMEWYVWGLLSIGIFALCRRADHWITAKNWTRFFVVHLAGALLFVTLHVASLSAGARIEAAVFKTGLGYPELFLIVTNNHFHVGFLTYFGIAGIWHAVQLYRRFRERELRAAELEVSLSRAQLEALQMQLHPHFLFNTLNTIAELVHVDPTAADRTIVRLSELLRTSLAGAGTHEVALRTELENLRRYLEIEQVRLGDRLVVRWEIASDVLEAEVPTFILQPLVENAIRHGIAPFSRRGEIHIEAYRRDSSLCLAVRDSGPGLGVDRKGITSFGIGLANTRSRLQRLYGERQKLELSNSNGFVVQIEIPIHEISREATPARVL
jgi:two-component system LytT family sensor kinase